MFKQNLDLSLSTKVTTVAHDKGSYVCPVQFLPTRHSSVLLGPSVVSVAPPMQIKTPGGQIRKKEKKKKSCTMVQGVTETVLWRHTVWT